MPTAYQIAVTGTPLPPLTYLGDDNLTTGLRVIVPVGNRQQVGLILGVDEAPSGKFTLRDIIAVLDEAPLWIPSELALLDWCSRYYHANWGRVLETALPTVLRQAKIAKPSKRPLSVQPAQPNLVTLNDEQESAFVAVQQQLGSFHVSLLEGVTGSGKTEVYASSISEVLAKGQQALLLVPEIGLTPQMLARLEQRLGTAPVALHSGLTDVARGKVWQLTRQGEPLLLIGTRSAIFAPLPKLGLIIVDEEHDGSYKQQDSIRYHARDVAIMRGKLQSCPVLLGSATPSLESLANVAQHKYSLLRLTQRANSQPVPQLLAIDMRAQKLEGALSPQLLAAIQSALDNDEQVLLFLNRRGYAPVLMCHDCGHTLDCPACEVPYTFHRSKPNLRCHHCGRVAHSPRECPQCGSQNWHLVGQGTQQLEEVLAGHFPHYPVLRIDRDSAQGKDKLPELLAQVRDGSAKLILGTQMLAKGHDFAGIQLVGIIDVDSALFARDFRTLERLAQLVTQVSGRAGRGNKAGKVLLQTHQPHHSFVQSLLTHPYDVIAQDLLAERQETHLPPFGHSAWLMAEGRKLEAVQQQLNGLLAHISDPQVQVSGPMPALMHRRQYHYRELLWLQSDNRAALHTTISQLLDALNQPNVAVSGVRVFLDIDPQDMP